MKKYDSIIIGHISKDYNTDHLDNTVAICGGAVLYSSASAYALGRNVAAITRISKSDEDRIKEFTIPEEDIYVIECESSTTMSNKYFTPDKERRDTAALSVGTPFKIGDVPEDIDADIYHFAGLVYGDYPDEMIKYYADKGDIALDVQTCLRHVDKETGKTSFKDWKTKLEMLPYITYLKTDAAEAEIMTGTTDRAEAAKILYGWGAKEIMITHNTEVLIYDGKEIYTCPIKARNLSGRTGRGDTTFAAYINERLYNDIPTSLLYATATVSLKMETPGAFRGTRADVDEYINLLYK